VHAATELLSTNDAKERLRILRGQAKALDGRFRTIFDVGARKRILEIGAAFGGLTIGFAELGYASAGVEPNETALATANELAKSLRLPCRVVKGTAESIPFPDQSFDIVIASSVLEHVRDLDCTFQEVSRVLAPGGMFYFSTASAMCPFQNEIRGFPFFGWYPNSLKLQIMDWAKRKRPALVGYTSFPAVHWFTDQKAARYLSAAGFGTIWDRWDLRQEEQAGKLYALALRGIKNWPLLKKLANCVWPMCAYAAVKKSC